MDARQATHGAAGGEGPAENRRATLAALDLGTNNCRLLIARPTRPGAREPFRVIDAFSRITRLGEGIQATGRLSDGAMERTIDALAICARRMRNRQATLIRAVATEACRRASNGQQFLDRVRARTGITFEVISPSDEARLAFAGCAALFEKRFDRALLFDIGGGSTEIVSVLRDRFGEPVVEDLASLPCGVVTFADRYDGREVSSDAYAAMKRDVAALVEPFRARIGDILGAGSLQLLGSSGTVTTLAAAHLDLPRYDRRRVDGVWMEQADVLATAAKLQALSFEQRVAHPCILADRADLVIVGAAILEALLDVWPAGRIRVADRGVREGLLMGLLEAA